MQVDIALRLVLQKEETENPKPNSNRERLYTIIFEADTPAGKAFDVTLLWLILISI